MDQLRSLLFIDKQTGETTQWLVLPMCSKEKMHQRAFVFRVFPLFVSPRFCFCCLIYEMQMHSNRTTEKKQAHSCNTTVSILFPRLSFDPH